MTPAERWSAGLEAAAKLSRVPDSRILLGAGLPVDELHELARLAGVPVQSQAGVMRDTNMVIEYFFLRVGQCELTAAASRPATEEEARDATAKEVTS